MNSETNLGFFNIGTGKATTVLELSHLMIKLSGNNFEPVFEDILKGDIQKSVANTENANKFLDWEAKIKLDNGLSTMISAKLFQ